MRKRLDSDPKLVEAEFASTCREKKRLNTDPVSLLRKSLDPDPHHWTQSPTPHFTALIRRDG